MLAIRLIFFDYSWTVIRKDEGCCFALCDDVIAKRAFDKNFNDYESSSLKTFLNKWLDKKIKETEVHIYKPNSLTNEHAYSKFSTEELVKAEQSAYAAYYKLATKPLTNPTKKDLEQLDAATNELEAIREELCSRKKSLNVQIESASYRAAETKTNGKANAKEREPGL